MGKYHCVGYALLYPIKIVIVFLEKDVVKILTEILRGIESRYDMELEQIGMDRDYIRLLLVCIQRYR